MRFLIVMMLVIGGWPATADPVDDVALAASAAFDRMPVVRRVGRMMDICGADESVNDIVAYCTTRNTIYITNTAAELPQAGYLVAHSFGHAVQVQHGVADAALAQIRARRDEEQMLRGLVARQVDCIAGFLMARAGQPTSALTEWMDTEPFAGIHWGRDPLRVGPSVSIGLDERATWFARGQGGDLSKCAAGEFGAGLLLAALNN